MIHTGKSMIHTKKYETKVLLLFFSRKLYLESCQDLLPTRVGILMFMFLFCHRERQRLVDAFHYPKLNATLTHSKE